MIEKDDRLDQDLSQERATDDGLSQVPSMDAADEEKSAFFEEWKHRHQAYLASLEQGEQSEEVEKEAEETVRPAKPGLFQGLKLQKVAGELSSTDEKEERVSKEPKPALPSKVIWKAVPVLVTSLLLAAASLYFISPTSKKKDISVSGNERLTAQQVEEYSLISPKDYVLTTALDTKGYAANIKKNSPSVESAKIEFQFPNRFNIQIKEYAIIGYVQEGGQTYPVLSNGELGTEAIASDSLPEVHTTINLMDRDLIKKLALALSQVDSSIREKIQTINLTPSKVTADLLTLTMSDGNTILVPLSDIQEKLPYYSKIALQVSEPTTIDMEVGIYRYAS